MIFSFQVIEIIPVATIGKAEGFESRERCSQ